MNDDFNLQCFLKENKRDIDEPLLRLLEIYNAAGKKFDSNRVSLGLLSVYLLALINSCGASKQEKLKVWDLLRVKIK